MSLGNVCIIPMEDYLKKQYYIPNYQREYSWGEDELADFWSDLSSVKDGDEEVHFFGQVVIHKKETRNDDKKIEKRYIIDGQQRTISSFIFIRALQILFAQLYLDSVNTCKKANKRDSAITVLIGDIEECETYHMNLCDNDNDYFIKKILEAEQPSEKKETHKSKERLRKAFIFFYTKLKAEISEIADIQDKVDELDKFYKAFTERFQVLLMEATELEEAFIIFETLNARGRELETADLLKNYIFSRCGKVDDAQKKWNSMNVKLDGADLTKYIRHFWNSGREFTREKALYRKISSTITTPRECRDFLDDLESLADVYHDIDKPEECIFFTDDALIKKLIALKTLKAKTFYPVVIAMIRTKNYKIDDISCVIGAIESYVFRNFTVCGQTANEGERFFSDLAKSIYDGKIECVDDIVNKIRAKMVDDEQFSIAFNSWTVPSSRKAIVRYALSKIHSYLDKSMEINIDTSDVHIEHIMPVNKELWDSVSEDVHSEYLWRFGNLALMSGNYNIKMSNKPFDEKKEYYRESKIEPNRALCNYETWGSDEIAERQEEFSRYALIIWKKR